MSTKWAAKQTESTSRGESEKRNNESLSDNDDDDDNNHTNEDGEIINTPAKLPVIPDKVDALPILEFFQFVKMRTDWEDENLSHPNDSLDGGVFDAFGYMFSVYTKNDTKLLEMWENMVNGVNKQKPVNGSMSNVVVGDDEKKKTEKNKNKKKNNKEKKDDKKEEEEEKNKDKNKNVSRKRTGIPLSQMKKAIKKKSKTQSPPTSPSV
jgi:hypothetical protein